MAQISCGFPAAAADIAQVDFIIGPGFAHLSLLDRKISSSAVKSVGANRLKFKFPAIKTSARIKEGGGGGMFRQITKCFFDKSICHICVIQGHIFCDFF